MGVTGSWIERQNSAAAIAALAAADFSWGQAQRLRAIQLGLIVVVPTLLTVFAQFFSTLAVAASYVGFALTVVDTTLIYPLLARLRVRAAQLQDLFDSIALSIQRSNFRQMCDPDAADIQSAAAKQNATRAKRNHNWYTHDLGILPLPVGRIACMLESAAWDGGLRERWSNALLVCGVLLTLAIVAWGAFGPYRDELATRVLFPLLPVIVWGGREYWDQRQAVAIVTTLREATQRAWNDALAGRLSENHLDAAAVELASAFFAYRSATPPAPHYLYSVLRPSQTASLQQAAQARVQAYEQHGGLGR